MQNIGIQGDDVVGNKKRPISCQGRTCHNPEMTELPDGPLPVGAQAPGFVLRRTFEESVDLDELLDRGPVVVAFYVFDFGNI